MPGVIAPPPAPHPNGVGQTNTLMGGCVNETLAEGIVPLSMGSLL